MAARMRARAAAGFGDAFAETGEKVTKRANTATQTAGGLRGAYRKRRKLQRRKDDCFDEIRPLKLGMERLGWAKEQGEEVDGVTF